MKSKPWQIHIFNVMGCIEPAEDKSKLLGVGCLYTRGAARVEEFSQSFVLEASYHSRSVTYNESGINLKMKHISISRDKLMYEYR